MNLVKLLTYRDKYPPCLSSNTKEVNARILTLLLAEDSGCMEKNPNEYSWYISGGWCFIRGAGVPTKQEESWEIKTRLGLPSYEFLYYCLNILPCRGCITLPASDIDKGIHISNSSNLLGIWLAEVEGNSQEKYAVNFIHTAVGDAYFLDLDASPITPPITTVEDLKDYLFRYEYRFRYIFYIMEGILI